MAINKIKLHLDKKYILKPLDKDTLLKCISGEHPSILHRLYLITNELKEDQHFMELDHEFYQCEAKVRTRYPYAGKAKMQASTISFMKDKVKGKQRYLILFRIYEKVGMREVFQFRHETTSVRDLISVINKLETKTKEICQNKANTSSGKAIQVS